ARTAHGELVGIGAAVVDVTGRKRADRDREELHAEVDRERRLLLEVLKQVPAGVVLAGPDGHLLLSNDSARRIWAAPLEGQTVRTYRPGRMLRPDGRAYPPEELPLTRAIERGEMAVAEEVQLDRYDGTRAVVLTNAAPIRDAQ